MPRKKAVVNDTDNSMTAEATEADSAARTLGTLKRLLLSVGLDARYGTTNPFTSERALFVQMPDGKAVTVSDVWSFGRVISSIYWQREDAKRKALESAASDTEADKS